MLGGFELSVVEECVEFEAIFSLCLVFWRGMAGNVGRQLFEGDGWSLFGVFL